MKRSWAWGGSTVVALLSTLVAAAPISAMPVGALAGPTGVAPADVSFAPRAALRASVVLKALRVRPEVATTQYDRDLFHHWIDIDGDGCDTRREVLIAEATTSPSRSGSCTLFGGRWWSAYDGISMGDSRSFDIDHFVPLAEAWRSGAWRWSYTTRESFANDLGYAGSLIAVTASSNRSKSDQDPAAWLPSRSAYRCTYASTWLAVKYRWSLAIDRGEKLALGSLLRSCGNPSIVLPSKARIVNDQSESAAPSGGGSSTGGSSGTGATDPRYGTCTEAKSHGYGPYYSGVDAEYSWYRDADSDGKVCE